MTKILIVDDSRTSRKILKGILENTGCEVVGEATNGQEGYERYVELKPDIVMTEADIMEFCSSLPRYKRPRRIIFDDIPRNPTGKIEKPRLREKYCGRSLVESQVTN